MSKTEVEAIEGFRLQIIVALKPFPEQFEGIGSGDPEAGEFFEGFSKDRAAAWMALERYWMRLGVEPIGRAGYFALCQSYKHPGVDDLLESWRAAALPHAQGHADRGAG